MCRDELTEGVSGCVFSLQDQTCLLDPSRACSSSRVKGAEGHLDKEPLLTFAQGRTTSHYKGRHWIRRVDLLANCLQNLLPPFTQETNYKFAM